MGHGRTVASLGVLLTLLGACGGGDPPQAADPALGAQLIEVARDGDLEAVRSLLERGATVEAQDAAGATALVTAAYGNHVDVARELLEAGADVNGKDVTEQNAFLIATSEVGDDPALLDLTLEHGGDIAATDSFKGTGLIRAADRGHVEMVERLLELEIDVDHVNRLGWTALLEAIILGGGGERHTEVVRLLVAGGADVDLADDGGLTPLAHARASGYSEIAEILKGAGARG